jgi:RimJ/RimL family protein N-acetyltransferase
MPPIKIRLEKFGTENYDELISWVGSEEMLMQFAGPLFNFPLTAQQLDISLSDRNRFAFRVVDNETNLTLGHAEVYLAEKSAKIGRLLIARQEHRSRGLGQQIIGLLLDFSFDSFDISMVELNVFDWNTEAIKCYENTGFTFNPDKKLERKIKNETWTALNMPIHKWKYERIKLINNNTCFLK